MLWTIKIEFLDPLTDKKPLFKSVIAKNECKALERAITFFNEHQKLPNKVRLSVCRFGKV